MLSFHFAGSKGHWTHRASVWGSSQGRAARDGKAKGWTRPGSREISLQRATVRAWASYPPDGCFNAVNLLGALVGFDWTHMLLHSLLLFLSRLFVFSQDLDQSHLQEFLPSSLQYQAEATDEEEEFWHGAIWRALHETRVTFEIVYLYEI